MPFVKLDCGMLHSSIWIDRPAREIFITALLIGEPYVVDKPMHTLKIRSLDSDSFVVPPGCYGLVNAAGSGIISACGWKDVETGKDALERLAAPDLESRSKEHDGRRMVRVSGGFIILNFEKYRKKDVTAAERAKRYREKQKELAGEGEKVQEAKTVTRDYRDAVTQGEAEAEAEAVSSVRDGVGSKDLSKASSVVEDKSTTALVRRPTRDSPMKHAEIQRTLEDMGTWEMNAKELRHAQVVTAFSYWLHKMDKRAESTHLSPARFSRLEQHIKDRGCSWVLYAIDGAKKNPRLNQQNGKKYRGLDSILPHDLPDRVEESVALTQCAQQPIHPLIQKHPELQTLAEQEQQTEEGNA